MMKLVFVLSYGSLKSYLLLLSVMHIIVNIYIGK